MDWKQSLSHTGVILRVLASSRLTAVHAHASYLLSQFVRKQNAEHQFPERCCTVITRAKCIHHTGASTNEPSLGKSKVHIEFSATVPRYSLPNP